MAKRESHEHETRDSSPIQGSTLPDVLLNGGVLGKVSHMLSTPIGGQPAAEAPASGAPASGGAPAAGAGAGGAGGAGSA